MNKNRLLKDATSEEIKKEIYKLKNELHKRKSSPEKIILDKIQNEIIRKSNSLMEITENLKDKEIKIVCDEYGYEDYQKAIRYVRRFYTKQQIYI